MDPFVATHPRVVLWLLSADPTCRFHGNGLITFPNGCRFISTWQLNQLASATLHFPDELTAPTLTSLPSNQPTPSPLASWTYCTDADRRFHTEHTYGLVLASSGRGRLVDGSMRPLPLGCYDVGDGWVGEEGGRVRGWEGRADVRECSEVELEWAKQKCRIGRDVAYTRTDL